MQTGRLLGQPPAISRIVVDNVIFDTSPEMTELALTSVRDAERRRDLTPQQWESDIAAWLGWLFDGLDMKLYTLVAARFVMQLPPANSPSVKQYRS
jgi:hypothetical protein